MPTREQNTHPKPIGRKAASLVRDQHSSKADARKAAEIRARQEHTQRCVLTSVLGTAVHFFGPIEAWFSLVRDPRDPSRITYPMASLLWAGILMFVCRVGARRQVGLLLRNETAAANFGVVFGVEGVPHGDTLESTFRRLDPDQGQEAVSGLVETLIRKRVLERARLLDRFYVVAVDGTGYLSFDERHCATCLTRTHKGGTTTYYHTVLEAKVVTPTGLALSLMTEFIENDTPNASKQDCELKAFYRLCARLKARFPRLPILLSLDGLFAGGPTFQLCADYGWRFIVVLQDADLVTVHRAFEALAPRQTPNTLTYRPAGSPTIAQHYGWVNAIAYTDSHRRAHHLSMLVCTETTALADGSHSTTTFKWVTNCHLTATSVVEVATDAGRARWKIENEGFNVQKNGGYDLEHAYTTDFTSAKMFYFLLQIAHLLTQLVTKGDLLTTLVGESFGSVKNLAFRFLEALRNTILASDFPQRLLQTRFQIRFDSS